MLFFFFLFKPPFCIALRSVPWESSLSPRLSLSLSLHRKFSKYVYQTSLPGFPNQPSILITSESVFPYRPYIFKVQKLATMDPVTFEKFQAMKRYNKTKYRQTLLQYLVTALVLGVCISKALSSFSSSLFSSIKLLFSISLPDIGGIFVSPKCLFVVCNAIVLFLVRESNLTGPSSRNSENIYEDYILHQRRRPRRQRPAAVYHAKENKEKSFGICMGKRADDEMIGHIRERKGERVVQGEKEREVEKEDGEEEVNEREVNELNRRIEDFFARVNRQRKLEAEMPD